MADASAGAARAGALESSCQAANTATKADAPNSSPHFRITFNSGRIFSSASCSTLPAQLGRAEDAHLHLTGEPVTVHRNLVFQGDLHRLVDLEVELQTVALHGAGEGLRAFGAAQV